MTDEVRQPWAFLSSMEIDKIAPALVVAQKAMMPAAKTAENPHFRSKYANLAAVIEAVKGPLNEAGIAFLQMVRTDTTGITVTTLLMHESAQWIGEAHYLPVPQQTPQAYGSAISYAKRYSLQSMCGLPSEDDDGEKASQPEKADAHRVEAPKEKAALEKPPPAELSEEEKKTLRAHAAQMTRTHEAKGDVKAYYEAQRFDDAQKMALWLYLPPAVRAALKAAPTPLELGSQG